MEKNPDRENILKVWKDYTIEDAMITTEKAIKAITSKTANVPSAETKHVTSSQLSTLPDQTSREPSQTEGDSPVTL